MVVHGDDFQHVVKVLEAVDRLELVKGRQLAADDDAYARRDIRVIGATIEAVEAFELEGLTA